MRNGKEMLRVSRVYFYQHDDTDFTESTNGKVKTENGKLVYRTQKAQKTQNNTDIL